MVFGITIADAELVEPESALGDGTTESVAAGRAPAPLLDPLLAPDSLLEPSLDPCLFH